MSLNRQKTAARILAMLLVLGPLPALAQDAGLYAAAPKPGTSFIRLIAPVGGKAVVNGVDVKVPDDGVTDYVNVPNGAVDVAVGSNVASVTVSPGLYYTLYRSDAGEHLFEDETSSDASKAQVYFYNLTDIDPVDLYVPAAKVDAITGIAAGQSKVVALRASLVLDFEVHSGTKTVASVSGVELDAKHPNSLILLGSSADPKLVHVVNSIATQ